MRIEILTQDDPIYILPFFEEFFGHYAQEFEILQVSSSPTMGKRPRAKLLMELAALYGPTGLVRLLMRTGAARALGMLPKTKNAISYYSLAQLCRSYGIAYKRIENPNAAVFVDSVRRRSPDVLISVACPFILKQPLLNIAPRGAINIHHAPLPRYKGMMPTFWQMFHGEKTVGTTIHYMMPKLDEGKALYQGQEVIEPGESLDHLIRRSKRNGAHCFARVLREVKSGTVTCKPLNESEGSYFTFPTLAEIREFRRRGLRAM